MVEGWETRTTEYRRQQTEDRMVKGGILEWWKDGERRRQKTGVSRQNGRRVLVAGTWILDAGQTGKIEERKTEGGNRLRRL
jgi:hypothetical protein